MVSGFETKYFSFSFSISVSESFVSCFVCLKIFKTDIRASVVAKSPQTELTNSKLKLVLSKNFLLHCNMILIVQPVPVI